MKAVSRYENVNTDFVGFFDRQSYIIETIKHSGGTITHLNREGPSLPAILLKRV